MPEREQPFEPQRETTVSQGRDVRQHFLAYEGPAVNQYGKKETIGVQELPRLLKGVTGTEAVEALAERDVHVQSASSASLASLLEQKQVSVNVDLLKQLIQEHHPTLQRFAFRLAGGVSKRDLFTFLSAFDAEYDTVWYDSSDRPDPRAVFAYDIPREYEQFDHFQQEIFSLIGRAIHRQDLSQEERKRFETVFLSLVKKYIRDHFLGKDKSQSEKDKQGYRRAYRGSDYRVNVLQPAFESLGKFGGAESVRFMKEWVQFYPDALTNEVIDALSTIDAALASKEFLPLLKDKDSAVVRAATRVLHRLEFGRIGISEEGARYLGKLYDLGEKNNPEYFVQRLTADGSMGVFDEKRKLINHFPLEGLDTDEARIKAQVLDFTLETLFTPRKDETPEERVDREQALKEFQENYFDFYNDNFFKETGVQSNNLSLKEQGQLLLFYKSTSEKEQNHVLGFVKKYKEDGFRAFLSLEYGVEMGSAILTIGEQLPQEAAERVFAKYSEIVRATENVQKYVEEHFGEQAAQDPTAIDHIVENLLRRGKDLLVRFQKESATKKDARDLIRELDQVKIDILLFASAFREEAQKSAIEFAMLRDVRFETVPGAELLEDPMMVETMKKIYRENYTGERYSEALRTALLEGFSNALEDPDAHFYVFRYKDDIAAFCRFDDIRDSDGRLTEKYFGSFNTSPQFARSHIGVTMLEKIIAHEANAGVPIVAECDREAPITARYLNMGFQIEEQSTLHGLPIFRIVLPPVSRARRTQSAREEALVA